MPTTPRIAGLPCKEIERRPAAGGASPSSPASTETQRPLRTVRAIECRAVRRAIELTSTACLPMPAQRRELEEEQLANRVTVCTAPRPAGGRKPQPSYTKPGSFRPSPPPGRARDLVRSMPLLPAESTSKPLEHVSNVACSALLPILAPVRCVGSPCRRPVPLAFAASGGVAHGPTLVSC